MSPSPDSQAFSQQSPQKSLDRLLQSILEGYSPTAAEATQLWQLTHKSELQAMGQAADHWRKILTGETIHWQSQGSLFFTNLCELKPCIYDYPRDPGTKGAYIYTIDEMDAKLEAFRDEGIEQVFLTGGFWSALKIPGLEAPTVLQTYGRMVRHIREHYPSLRIHAFSPDEIEFLRILSDRSVPYVLAYLQDAGLTSLSGHFAEILVDRVRAKISPKLMKVKDWFSVIDSAYQLGIPTTATMSYGHVETPAERGEHLGVLCQFLKTHENAFQGFIPVPISLNTTLKVEGVSPLSSEAYWQAAAVARLVFGENLQTIVCPWSLQPSTETSIAIAQEALTHGANHFGTTDSLDYVRFLTGNSLEGSFTAEEFKALIAQVRP